MGNKRYTQHQLYVLVERIRSLGYRGLANEIRWINSFRSQGLYPEYEDVMFNVRYENLPLYINDENEAIVEIAKWRLETNK